MPPDSSSTRVSRRSAQVRDLERALDRRRALVPAEPVEPREHAQVLLDGERRVEVVELGDDAALGPRLLRLAGQPVAEHLELALVGDRLRRQHLHGRRLAGAVRAQEADAGARRHVQVEPVDGRDRPKRLVTPRIRIAMSAWRATTRTVPRGPRSISRSRRGSTRRVDVAIYLVVEQGPAEAVPRAVRSRPTSAAPRSRRSKAASMRSRAITPTRQPDRLISARARARRPRPRRHALRQRCPARPARRVCGPGPALALVLPLRLDGHLTKPAAAPA